MLVTDEIKGVTVRIEIEKKGKVDAFIAANFCVVTEIP